MSYDWSGEPQDWLPLAKETPVLVHGDGYGSGDIKVPSLIAPIAIFVGGIALVLAVLLVSFYATTIVQQWLPWLQ